MNNNYLVPMWSYKNNQMKNHLALINAQDRYQAMLIAIGSYKYPENDSDSTKCDLDSVAWHVDMNYESYQECENPSNIFTYMDRSATIRSSQDKEDSYMDIYDYMQWGDYNARIKELAEKALPEKWSFGDKDDYSILKNYLKYTFINLQNENKIIETETYCVFDTGLFSNYYVPIYAYGELNKNPSENTAKWFFKGFKDKYELGALDVIEKFPERADYFSDPSKLVFNWHLEVNINHKHILDDLRTLQRLPESIKNSDIPLESLTGVIDTAVKRVIANYKLAVPHYYCNKIQLMIPLYFGKSDTPDVALVLDRMKGNYYQATTCLSMEMAYMDARIIAKPESNWLSI